MKQREIFTEALKRQGAARNAHLEQACGDDRQLRRSVEELLAEHEKDDTFFLDTPPNGLAASGESGLERAETGMRIGRYTLLEPLGEGGMGVVYRAEQHEPVRRHVAVKIIKPGMDGRQVIARFKAERQALAMRFPNSPGRPSKRHSKAGGSSEHRKTASLGKIDPRPPRFCDTDFFTCYGASVSNTGATSLQRFDASVDAPSVT